MKTIQSVVILGILGGVIWSAMADCGTCEASKEKLVTLVDKAAALIQKEGESAFAEFRKKGSEWFQGDLYIFVDDMEGKNLCHPVTPGLEGKNLLDMKDAEGKEFVREMIDLLKTKDAGWVEYSFAKPGAAAPLKKIAYVKKTMMPSGTAVLAGAGIYVD